MMIDWARRLLGIKSDVEIVNGVVDEPTIKNARRALARARKWTGVTEDILADYEEAEAARIRRPH